MGAAGGLSPPQQPAWKDPSLLSRHRGHDFVQNALGQSKLPLREEAYICLPQFIRSHLIRSLSDGIPASEPNEFRQAAQDIRFSCRWSEPGSRCQLDKIVVFRSRHALVPAIANNLVSLPDPESLHAALEGKAQQHRANGEEHRHDDFPGRQLSVDFELAETYLSLLKHEGPSQPCEPKVADPFVHVGRIRGVPYAPELRRLLGVRSAHAITLCPLISVEPIL